MARTPRILKPQIVVPVLFFATGFLVGWGVIQRVEAPQAIVTDSGVRISGKYQLVSPLLLCSSTETTDLRQVTDLQNKLNAQIQAAEKAGEASDISVYLRDFSGHWVGINDDEQYAPASLLKVPIMIAYLKEAEQEPGLLSQTLTYDGSVDLNTAEDIRSPNDIKPGSYTIDALIKAMIEYSDNNALQLLSDNMDKKWLSEVYTDLGLSVKPDDPATADTITAKQYSYFFRILYNATYLTPADSEKALEYLAASDFPQGIRSTVPASATVASKFGERSIFTLQGAVIDRELHDCGIIYAPNKTYLLCIMTRGKDFSQLTNVIDEIGKTVYSEMVGS